MAFYNSWHSRFNVNTFFYFLGIGAVGIFILNYFGYLKFNKEKVETFKATNTTLELIEADCTSVDKVFENWKEHISDLLVVKTDIQKVALNDEKTHIKVTPKADAKSFSSVLNIKVRLKK